MSDSVRPRRFRRRSRPIREVLVCPPRAGLRCLALVALTLAVAAAGPRAGWADSPPPDRPNVVFILADDLGYMDVGVNNPKTFYETPQIDGLAARGMRFTAGYAACPVCSPTSPTTPGARGFSHRSPAVACSAPSS